MSGHTVQVVLTDAPQVRGPAEATPPLLARALTASGR